MKIGLPTDNGLDPAVMASLELMPKSGRDPLLTDVQHESLIAGVARGNSALISAPTSTGKTLIGWWAISSAVISGGRAVYLVSHRALAKQKFEEAQRLFLSSLLNGDRSAIVCATGDGVEDASGRKTNAPLTAKILIATYEKFLGCLSVGGPPRDLTDTTFVCDEVQLVGDQHRGRNVELLLTLMRRSGWKQFVGLSAVLHETDALSLASWLGVELVRNPTREKALKLECRGLETVHEISIAPNIVSEIAASRRRSERTTNNIVRELLGRPGYGPVIVFCMKVDDTYSLCNEWIQGRTQLIEVTAPDGLELEVGLHRALMRRAAYHNAELSEDERIFVEHQVDSGLIDVIYATSTLAAGVNFPLGSAIFASWTRYNFDRRQHEPIGRAEFHNMAGRVGRMGQSAAEGHVLMTADSNTTLSQALKLLDFTTQDELGVGINPEDFGSLTLQLFAGKLCSSRQDAFRLVSSTLSAAREIERNASGVAHWEGHLNLQIDRLVRTGCLIESRSRIGVTAFGLSVARSGLKPETALYFIDGLVQKSAELAQLVPAANSANREDDLLFILSHAALTSPEFNYEGGNPTRQISWRVGRPNLVPNDFARRLDPLLWDRPWMADVSAANGALLVVDWAGGSNRGRIEGRVSGVRLGTVEALARDVGWILTGIAEILAEVTAPTLADESKPASLRGENPSISGVRQLSRAFRRMAVRISSGLPSDVLWINELELPGARRRLSRLQVLSLRHHGLIKPNELMDGGQDADSRRRLALPGTGGPGLANQVRDAARRWKGSEREHFRQLHARRAARLNAEEIIEALYTKRGNELETAFEKAMDFISVECEALDHNNKQSHPDFLIKLENFQPIVVEIKSKLSDTDLVSLNNATEVLSASELLGLRENFCITLCSPGVEPNVPGIIERCGRLCVIEVSSLAEAILRIKEGALTRQDFHNWLTTPGVAVSADLPHPSST